MKRITGKVNYVDVKRNFLPKNERLCLQKDIDSLFASGQSFVSYPLRIVYLFVTQDDVSKSDISILISVPKKRIKKAVTRNRIKRLIRESYRHNKNESSKHCKQKGKHLHIAFLYMSYDLKKYADIEKAMRKALDMIVRP